MKDQVKRIVAILCAAIIFLTSGAVVSAAETTEPIDCDDGVSIAAVGGGENDTMADVIVWKYKTVDGKLYKRRWNQTKSVWVDSAWILVG